MKRIVLQLLVLASAAVPAFSGTIDYVCDTTDSNAIPTSVCTTLQTTIAGQYGSIFSNANAVIYVQYGSIGSNVGENTQYYSTVSYQTYYNALETNATGAAATAIANLPACSAYGNGGFTCQNPVVSGDGVALTSSLDAALGLAGGIGICTAATNTPTNQSCNASQPTCILGTANCFNDIISISNGVGLYYDTGQYQSNEYDFFSIVEHETDEALGTSSCLQNGAQQISSGCMNGRTGVSAADLFRYSAPGVRSYIGPGGDQSNGTTLAYFSINGGVTEIAPYNNSSNGNDWGDWSTSCTSTFAGYVQDAVGCSMSSGAGLNIENDGGVEIAVLNAVGYQLTPEGQSLEAVYAPEPGTIGTFVLGLCAFAGIVRRQRRAAKS